MRGLSVGIRALAATGIVMAVAGEVRADPALRVQLTQRGGFLLIGKPLGHDCNQPKPVGAMQITWSAGQSVMMTGPAITVFSSEIEIPD